jgi:hypothetical protein
MTCDLKNLQVQKKPKTRKQIKDDARNRKQETQETAARQQTKYENKKQKITIAAHKSKVLQANAVTASVQTTGIQTALQILREFGDALPPEELTKHKRELVKTSMNALSKVMRSSAYAPIVVDSTQEESQDKLFESQADNEEEDRKQTVEEAMASRNKNNNKNTKNGDDESTEDSFPAGLLDD